MASVWEDRMSSQMDGTGSYQRELYCVFCTHPHAHMRASVLICDHTYGSLVVSENRAAVGKQDNTELDQHEAKINTQKVASRKTSAWASCTGGKEEGREDRSLSRSSCRAGLSSGTSP